MTKNLKADKSVQPNEKELPCDKPRFKIIKLKGIPVSVILVVSVIVLAMVSIFVNITITAFEPTRATVMTFWVSFFVGIAGAGVYLSLLLMTEKDIDILKNTTIPDGYLMTLLFLLSGGLVAATVQTSTAILTGRGLHAVFLLGFGWQGAVSGVANISVRKQLNRNYKDCTKNSAELRVLNRRITEEKRECADERRKQDKLICELRLELERARKEK